MSEQHIRLRNGALLMKVQSAEGTWASPATSDALLVESPSMSFDPVMIQTSEFNPSLDSRAPLPGGLKVGLTFRLPLKGSGVPGTAPEADPALRIAGLQKITTATTISGTDFSADSGTGKIAASSTDITALTVGTPIYVDGFATPSNNGEFVISAVGSGDITVTKADGSAHGLTTESAAASVSIVYGVAAVAATAGTTTTFTGQSPQSATADAYLFMPVYLSGNPATPVFTQLVDYTAARVGTLPETMGTALTTSTKVSIPANVTYIPASSSLPWASAELYSDGRIWQLIDLVVDSLKITWNPGGGVMAEFSAKGKMYAAENDAAVPDAVYDSTRPGQWRGSKFVAARSAIAVNALSFDVANTLSFPDNPNDAEGFDAPFITERSATLSMEPNLTLQATRDNYVNFREGTSQIVYARLAGGLAANAGQRIMQVAPAAIITARGFGEKEGRRTEQLTCFMDGFDRGFGLTFF